MLLLLAACLAPHPPPPAAEAAAPAPPALPPGPDLIDVAAPRELRGLWVTTVHNLDFPSRRGLDAEQAKAELLRIVETAHGLGFNALVFQVRSEADAVYTSALEPWSRFLTGTQGRDPGFDPLATLLTEAHARGMEVHAWFNPFRAAAAHGNPTAANHVSRTQADALCRWGKVDWLDPGDPEVRDHTLAVIDDVVRRYDVDGVHLDDYFYPYPDGDLVFPDADTYAAYRATGGTLERDAWRRQNVDTLVQAIGERVAAIRPTVRYGISPFGIWRPGYPEGIRGMDQVEKLHADPLAWYKQGWIHYLAPQLYWSTKKEGQRYGLLLPWWDAQVTRERPLLVGLDLTRVGTTSEWSLDELRAQVELSRQAANTAGQIWFRTRPVLEDQAGVAGLLRELYATPALPFATPGQPPARPTAIEVAPGLAKIAEPQPDDVRGYALYTGDGKFERFLPPATAEVPLASGSWAISAVRRGALESRALRFEVP